MNSKLLMLTNGNPVERFKLGGDPQYCGVEVYPSVTGLFCYFLKNNG